MQTQTTNNEPTKAQIEKFIKEKRKVYRYSNGGFYEFQGREYSTRAQVAEAIREYYKIQSNTLPTIP